VITKVLVALDGSARAPGVFDAAAEVAMLFGATLHPFRALFVPPEFPAAAVGSHSDPLPLHLSKEVVHEQTPQPPSARAQELIDVVRAYVK
jgi:hypothetical protein